MTSLRTFQTEIDEISHREVAKQRAQALAERAKLEKETKKTANKTHARKESVEATDASKPAAKEVIAAAGPGDVVMSDIDEQLQVSILFMPPALHEVRMNRVDSPTHYVWCQVIIAVTIT